MDSWTFNNHEADIRQENIVLYLYRMLWTFASNPKLGEVLVAPLRVQLWPGKFREPDLIFMLTEHKDRMQEKFWVGADLVVEVVSPDDRNRDLRVKRREYAQANILEYWIVDPQKRLVTILFLDNDGDHYKVYGEFSRGGVAESKLLPNLKIEVDNVFSAAE